jgi:opacity protein-like surface antigen
LFRKYKVIFAFLLFFTSAFAEDLDFVSIHGYGSIGGAYQNNSNILYRNSLNTDNGSKGNFSFETDSKFGLQMDAKPVDKLTITIQGLASQNNANDKLLSLEWANVKYQFNDNIDIRVGKMQLPAFMYSDVFNLSYAYDWVRLPDMYSTVPFHSYNGIEFNYARDYENFSVDLKLLYGKGNDNIKTKEFDSVDISDSKLTVDELYGAIFGVSVEDLKLRFAYTKFDFTLKNSQMDSILTQFNSFGIPIITDRINRYIIDHTSTSYIEFGLSYNFENVYIVGEYTILNSDSFKSDMNSWYISTGYHLKQWTPFVTFSKTTSKSNYKNIDIPIGSSPLVIGAITEANTVFTQFSNSSRIDQKSTSIGVRYDFMDNVALKLQYDYVQEKRDSLSVFMHYNSEPQTDLHVFSATINFVF